MKHAWLVVMCAACGARPAPAVTLPTVATSAPCEGPAWGPLVEDRDLTARDPEVSLSLSQWPDPIAEVSVTGDPVLAQSIAPLLETRRGEAYDPPTVRADLRRVWALGVAADARVEVTGAPDGPHVAFVITPHAAIDRVDAPDRPELSRLHALVGGAFEAPRIARIAAAIEDGYQSDGYPDARVRVLRARAPGVALCVTADRGPRVLVGAIHFAGAHAFGDGELRAAIAEDLKPGEPAGDTDHLARAGLVLSKWYWDHGFATVHVAEPKLTRQGDALDIDIAVTEGPLFHLGELRVIDTTARAVPAGVATGDVFAADAIGRARDGLHDASGPNAKVEIESNVNRETRTVDVTFVVTRS